MIDLVNKEAQLYTKINFRCSCGYEWSSWWRTSSTRLPQCPKRGTSPVRDYLKLIPHSWLNLSMKEFMRVMKKAIKEIHKVEKIV